MSIQNSKCVSCREGLESQDQVKFIFYSVFFFLPLNSTTIKKRNLSKNPPPFHVCAHWRKKGCILTTCDFEFIMAFHFFGLLLSKIQNYIFLTSVAVLDFL